MSDDRLMRDLAGQVREERTEDSVLPPELRRPLDDRELEAILDRATAGGRVVPMAPARRRWALYAGLAAPLAAAAIAVLVMHPVAGTNQTGSGVPPYDLIIEGGDQETRGAPADAPRPVVHVSWSGRLVL